MNFIDFFQPDTGDLKENCIDAIFQMGDVYAALTYFNFFMPKFLTVDGLVILDDGSENRVGEFSKAIRQITSKEALQEVQSSFNFVEVIYRFSHISDVSDAAEVKLAESVHLCWSLKLKHDFPALSFNVEIITPQFSGSVYAISFYQDTISYFSDSVLSGPSA